MSLLNSKFDFNHLSVKDLVEARDIFHVHLINKSNVIATAIGRYRVRKGEPWPNEEGYSKSLKPTQKTARTLENSEVRDYSWPCILVFVSQWATEASLLKDGSIVPRSIYLPDGRIVPICVVEAPKAQKVDDMIDSTSLVFPTGYVGGGFPVIIESQGQQRVASVGCLVTDGNRYFALTNKHVTGEAGTPIFTMMKGAMKQIGVGSGKNLGKIRFSDAYTDWAGRYLVVNGDIGLVEIDDLNIWKTDVLGIGELGELADLNTSNITLALVTALNPERNDVFPKMKAFGAVSGRLDAEVVGLFYRYKSVGGTEFVADFLLGGVGGKPLNIHHGDSGTLWLIDTPEAANRPIALHWGQHNFVASDGREAIPYALATNLTTACVALDVDVVRGWNVGNDYTWGKTGHFKVAAKSCELVSNVRLKKLLMANQKNIGYVDDDLLSDNVVSGQYKDSKDIFVPLADVADIIWRATRKADSSNHFADVDEINPGVANGKTLLELSLQTDANIDIDFWIAHFEALDAVDPKFKTDKNGNQRRDPREGALPFRVWQMYLQMIASLKKGSVAEFICAGGTMAHYVGDACQALHISALHHGRNADEAEVHAAYETTMLDRKMTELFIGVNAAATKIKSSDLIGSKGKSAAKRVIELMDFTVTTLPPVDICDSYTDNNHSTSKMWTDLGAATITNIAEGCQVMAILWQSAWKHGNGSAIPSSDLVEQDPKELRKLYNRKTFVESFKMKDPKFKAALK